MNLLLALAIFSLIAWFPGQAWALRFDGVQADSPAASVGLVAGDAILSVDGRRFDQFEGPVPLVDSLRANAGREVRLGIVHRDGTSQVIAVTLRGPSQLDAQHGALGIFDMAFQPSAEGFVRHPVDALVIGAGRTTEALGLIANGLGQIVGSIATHPTDAPPASGPVGIAISVGDVFWQAGPLATLYLAGILSANLALVNILPIPPFDGGRMLMLLIKSVAGNRVSVRAEQLAYLVGFGFLFGFLIWITYFDLARLGGAPQ
jgi:regulator of sigma E protease